MDRIIVSRHPAAVEFITRELGGERHPIYADLVRLDGQAAERLGVTLSEYTDWYGIRVIASATADDVRGKIVYTDEPLPLHLAALAAEVYVIEFVPFVAVEYDYDEETRCWGIEGPFPGLQGPKMVSLGLTREQAERVATRHNAAAALRGAGYTLADMDAAGARLVRWHDIGPTETYLGIPKNIFQRF